jgi:hypothetical protein
MFIHPEKRNNEIFFTNSSMTRFDALEFKTKRIGENAYDGDGNMLDIKDWFPVFIESEELKDNNIDLFEIRKKFRYEFIKNETANLEI